MNSEVAQKGVFENTSRHARLIEYVIKPSISEDSVKVVLKDLIQYVDCISDLNLNVSFGSDCWDRLNPSWRPAELVSFNALGTGELSMPGTQADIFIWLSSHDAEVIPFSVIDIYEKMKAIADIKLDLEGIKNKQERDLIGFVDGTANDEGDERLPVVLIPEGQLGAGGSYVLSQRWKHDLAAFNRLALHEQESVVGRTKEADEELEGDAMPENSHVSRTDAEVEGVSMKIYRRSYPYMASQLSAETEDAKPDNGLYFLALACEMQRFTVQLYRMLGLTEDGLSDKLMQFSTPKTGSYWFMPNKQDLATLVDLD